MPNSLKAKLSNLRYKGQITDAEYKELISKLNGHDRQILEDIKAEIEDLDTDYNFEGFYKCQSEVLKIINEKVKEHET